MSGLVAIVGRPNVGKSTLFNKIAGRKISITENRPGVTRDRIYALANWRDKNFYIVDTGGIELKSEDNMWKEILIQADIAIDMAQVIILLVDGRQELTATDYDVAHKLRRSKKPVLLAVNKIDTFSEDKIFDFYSLGLGTPYAISAEHSQGIGDLLDATMPYLEAEKLEDTESLKIAVVGKPNAGKSSLVNRILGTERSIVTDIAGTTRDAIDTPFTHNGNKYLLIDTAGIRRKRSVYDNIEYYSVLRALEAIRRADVCLAVIDSEQGITEQDVKILGYIHEQGKPSVIVMNKWDLIAKDTHTINQFEAQLHEHLKFMDYYQSTYISAKTGQRTEKVLHFVQEVYKNANFRVTTGTLNDLILSAVRANEPPATGGKRLKVYYASQPAVCPPTFVLSCNDEALMHFSYRRYLENILRRSFNFKGTPIKIIVRGRGENSML